MIPPELGVPNRDIMTLATQAMITGLTVGCLYAFHQPCLGLLVAKLAAEHDADHPVSDFTET